MKNENEEIFNDDGDRGKRGNDPFNEMRETKTGFGAKVKKEYSPGQLAAEGGLEPEDDDDDVGEDEDEEEGDEEVDVDEDEDEGVDNRF